MMRNLAILLIILTLVTGNAYADLSVHFIDVGQGDAALVVCDGEAMLIDGGPASASQSVYSYLRQEVDLTPAIGRSARTVGSPGHGRRRRSRKPGMKPIGNQRFPYPSSKNIYDLRELLVSSLSIISFHLFFKGKGIRQH